MTDARAAAIAVLLANVPEDLKPFGKQVTRGGYIVAQWHEAQEGDGGGLSSVQAIACSFFAANARAVILELLAARAPQPLEKPLHLRRCDGCGGALCVGPWVLNERGTDETRELRYNCTCNGAAPLGPEWMPYPAP